MIITCEKCSTTFNLDDSAVKEEGIKVRCAVCKNIFTAYPLPEEADIEPPAPMSLELEPDTDDDDDFKVESLNLEMEIDDGFEIEEDDSEAVETGAVETGAVETEADDDFSFEDDDFTIEEEDDDDAGELDFEDGLVMLEDDDMDGSGLDDDDPDDNKLDIASITGIDTAGDAEITVKDEIEFDDIEEEFDSIEFETIDDESDPVFSEEAASILDMDFEDETPGGGLKLEQNETQGISTGDEELNDEDDFALEFDVEDDSEIGVPDIDDGPGIDGVEGLPLEMTMESEDEAALSLEEDSEDTLPALEPEDDFSEYDAALEQQTEPEEITPEETQDGGKTAINMGDSLRNDATSIQNIETTRTAPQKKKSFVGTSFLILMLIVFLVIGAWIASIMTGYNVPYLSDIKIPGVEQYLKPAVIPPPPEIKPAPNDKSVNGRFVTNSTAGSLFIITGRVENFSNIAYKHIKVQGALITKAKDGAKSETRTKDVFCGNIITEEMLKTANISDINKALEVKSGNHNSNTNIKPGTSIPFMIVFSNLPENLGNYTVQAINYEKAEITK